MRCSVKLALLGPVGIQGRALFSSKVVWGFYLLGGSTVSGFIASLGGMDHVRAQGPSSDTITRLFSFVSLLTLSSNLRRFFNPFSDIRKRKLASVPLKGSSLVSFSPLDSGDPVSERGRCHRLE